VSVLLVFALYLAAMVGIGLWAASRNTDTEEDYFLAGRQMGPLVVALSAVSSGRSAWLVVGASGIAWLTGLSAFWVFPGYILAELLLFVSVGPRLRALSVATGAITIPEVLARSSRGGTALPLRQVAGAVTVLFMVTYVSAQLVAGGKTLEAVFDVDGKTVGLAVTAGIVLVYTFLGGYRAVAITDVIQALFMILGLVALPLIGLAKLGGAGALADQLRAIDPALLDWSPGWLVVVGGLAIGLGSPGQPPILVRHLSLRDPNQARKAAFWGTLWNVVMAGGALLMGLVGRVLYPTLESFSSGDREHLFATLGQDISAEYLLPMFVGVLLATLFAAIMSTCDSQLLVVASSLVRDFRRKDATEERGLARSRTTVVLALVVAVLLSYGADRVVYPFVLLSWGALGAAFGPAVLLLVYDRRTTGRGLLAAILTGAIGVAIAWYFWALPSGKSVTYHVIPPFLAAGLVGFLLRERGSLDS
jgi:sodium/proline symporter